jgi:hypothetical protein
MNLQNAVQICVNDLDPLVKKPSQWEARQDRKQWLGEGSNLREIGELVLKHYVTSGR